MKYLWDPSINQIQKLQNHSKAIARLFLELDNDLLCSNYVYKAKHRFLIN